MTPTIGEEDEEDEEFAEEEGRPRRRRLQEGGAADAAPYPAAAPRTRPGRVVVADRVAVIGGGLDTDGEA